MAVMIFTSSGAYRNLVDGTASGIAHLDHVNRTQIYDVGGRHNFLRLWLDR